MRIKDYKILDVGLEHPEYLNIGSGRFDEKVIGAGDDRSSAFDDALEQMAVMGISPQDLDDIDLFSGKKMREPNFMEDTVQHEDEQNTEFFYYVVIQFSLR